MPAPQIGDFIYGGVVFYVDTTDEYVLIEGPDELVGHYFNESSNASSTVTSANIGSGITNTIALLQNTSRTDAPQVISNFISPYTEYNDWFIGSLDEMVELRSSGVTLTPFYSTSLYGTSTTSGHKFKTIRGGNGATVYLSLVDNRATFRYIRKQSYRPPIISIENISGKIVNPRNDVFDFGNISNSNNISHRQEILIRGRGEFSRIICFYIDMTNLAEGYEATPQALFGQLPNIISVRTNSNKIWYADSSSGVTNLTSIVNGVAYQLTFSATTVQPFTIAGDVIRSITITVPQGESWFPMILGDRTEIGLIFGRDNLSKIISIHDLQAGNYFPFGGLKDLEISRGYIINTSSSFTHKFILR
tara:strand:- start:242 stop:1327 length:1086 start_codon:yes stop_codon:yes gene_type:complete